LVFDDGFDLDVSLDIQQPGRHPHGNLGQTYVPGPKGATELASPEYRTGAASSGDATGDAREQLLLADGHKIAYARRYSGPDAASRAGVVFLCGFRSDMTGSKATFLDSHCASRGLPFLRFDYSGHGASSGAFTDGTIGRWAEEAIAAIDRLTTGKLVLVGSSMGGWIMLLAALARPERIAGLVGIAPAPDFTEMLIWNRLDETARARLLQEGRLVEPSQYSDEPSILTRKLVEEGRDHLLLGAPIALDCPVRLLHGMDDPDVPFDVSLQLAEKLVSKDVRVTLIKDGDHRLSRDSDLAMLAKAVDELT
jgi:pimeloyl-ACP methyl ester carboxylesterase